MTNNSIATGDLTLADVANLFPPTELTEKEAALYQKTAAVRVGAGDYEFHERLYERIRTSRDKAHILVVGHGGCGKSTELRMLSLMLGNSGVPAITIEARGEGWIDLHPLIRHYIDKRPGVLD